MTVLHRSTAHVHRSFFLSFYSYDRRKSFLTLFITTNIHSGRQPTRTHLSVLLFFALRFRCLTSPMFSLVCVSSVSSLPEHEGTPVGRGGGRCHHPTPTHSGVQHCPFPLQISGMDNLQKKQSPFYSASNFIP